MAPVRMRKRSARNALGPAATLALAATLLIGGCGDSAPHEPPCGDHEFLYDYPRAGYVSTDTRACEVQGDSLCYTLCENDGDCSEGYACSRVDLENWGTYRWVHVCIDSTHPSCL